MAEKEPNIKVDHEVSLQLPCPKRRYSMGLRVAYRTDSDYYLLAANGHAVLVYPEEVEALAKSLLRVRDRVFAGLGDK